MGGDFARRLNYSQGVSDPRSETLRTACTLLAGLLLVGCSSNWKAYGIDTSCVDVTYFADLDEDGWGDPADEGTPSCEPPEAGNVRNNRDCDDSDPDVTGRIGALCPSQLVAQDAETDFTPVVSGSEFIAVHSNTELVWAAAAQQACGPYGWGGHLATFFDLNQLNTVLGAVSQDTYAAFVGYHPTLHEWGNYDDAGDWVAETEGGTFQAPLCNCVGSSDAGCGDVYTDDLRYLALVKNSAAANGFCLGTPDDADPGEGDPEYLRLYGHFICERDIPDPNDWELAPPGAGDDTAQ